jgi:hypothetical protein
MTATTTAEPATEQLIIAETDGGVGVIRSTGRRC